MKKISSFIIAAIILATMSFSAFAAEFVDSIEAKPAPDIINIQYGENYYPAVIIDKKEKKIEEGIPEYNKSSEDSILEFIIIPASEKSQAILPEITENITNAENQIKQTENIGKLTPGLDTEIAKVIDEFYGDSPEKISSSDLVVSDLFDVSLVRDKITLEQVKEGNQIRFIIEPSFAKNDFFILLLNADGANWEVVNDLAWSDDGYLIVTVDKMGIFAFAVEKTAGLPVDPHGPESPDTANQENFNMLYAGIAVICVGAAVFFFLNSKKAKNGE